MDNIVELSKLELKLPLVSVLNCLIEHDKSVLIKIPPNKSVWLIKESSGDCKAYINQSTYIGKRLSNLTSHRKRVISTELIECAEFIQLGKDDVKVLVKQQRYTIQNAKVVFGFDSEGEIKLSTAAIYLDDFIKELVENNIGKRRHRSDFPPTARDAIFIFTDKSVRELPENDDALNKSIELSIDLSSIFVFEEDVKEFIVNPLDRIGEDSPYYIPPKLRGKSDLDKLAEIGAKTCGYDARINAKSRELAEKVAAMLSYKDKKADVAAFFLQPNPKGKTAHGNPELTSRMAKLTKPPCQFPCLVYVLEEFFVKLTGANDKDGRECKTIQEDVRAFLENLGFSSDNAKYAEMFIRIKKS
jgi:hypothetical protein